MKWGLIIRNVAALTDPPQVQRREPRFLTPEQAQRLLSAAEGHPLEALYVTALMLGLRVGEALGLRWQDVDFDRRELHVVHTLQRVTAEGEIHSKLRLLPTKTAGSERTLTMPRAVVDALRAHRTRRGLVVLPSGYVFAHATGTPMEDDVARNELRALLDKAGLPRMRLHDLRHSCASFLLAAGVPPRMLMEMLGHASISTTMNLYAHVLPSLRQQAADAMDGLFPGNG
jgi:integrase